MLSLLPNTKRTMRCSVEQPSTGQTLTLKVKFAIPSEHDEQSTTVDLFLGPHKFPDFDTKIQRLKDMGVNDFDARAALSRHNWDLNRATEQLFS